MVVDQCCLYSSLLSSNTLFAKTLVEFYKHTFRTRDTGGSSIRRNTYNLRYLLVWDSLGSAEHEYNNVIMRHTGQRASNMLLLTNPRDTPIIRWQVQGLVIPEELACIIATFDSHQGPPGNTFTLS